MLVKEVLHIISGGVYMNYKTIMIEENKDGKENDKYIEFENIFSDLMDFKIKQKGMAIFFASFLLYNIPNYMRRNIDVLDVLIKLFFSFVNGVIFPHIFAALDYFVIRKNYWNALENIHNKQDFPKELSQKVHKKLVQEICKGMGIAENEQELSYRLNDYKIFYQFLRLKQNLIYNYKKTLGTLDKNEVIDGTKYNVYVNGELLTVDNMNMIDINDIRVDCLSNKKAEAKENVELAENVLSLKGANQRKNYEIHKLISLLKIKKETLLEDSKKASYQEEYQRLINDYYHLSEMGNDPGTIVVKVKSKAKDEL